MRVKPPALVFRVVGPVASYRESKSGAVYQIEPALGKAYFIWL
jgi:hypothetical protein